MGKFEQLSFCFVFPAINYIYMYAVINNYIAIIFFFFFQRYWYEQDNYMGIMLIAFEHFFIVNVKI